MLKAAIRRAYQAKRKSAETDWLAEQNVLIAENFREFLKDKTVTIAHTFLPQFNAREIDTYLLIGQLRATFPDIKIAAPYIIPGTREMRHFLFNSETQFTLNQWKIPEPDPHTSAEIASNEVDMVLIPLLAFDRLGYRVGYGGGYYDRFLVQCKSSAIKVGFSVFEPVDLITDTDSFDIPLDFCVTPTNLYDFRSSEKSAYS